MARTGIRVGAGTSLQSSRPHFSSWGVRSPTPATGAGGGQDRWHGDLEHLRREGLVALTPQLLGEQRALVTLTDTGRSVLEGIASHFGRTASSVLRGLGQAAGPHDAALSRVRRSLNACAEGAENRQVVMD